MKVGPVQPYAVSVYSSGAVQPSVERTTSPPVQSATARTTVVELLPAERELFIRLFPESAPYIARHVLFTREGRVQEPDIYKGLFVDVRA
ncbi:MAG: hypothetical protein RRA60_04615 [Chlorobiota bacterium]|jgi:hypothetical protein|nr:hypothetical protein [Chlorobiota bacterium]